MVMSLEGYQEALESQKQKDKDFQTVKERMTSIENILVAIQPLLKKVKPEMLSNIKIVEGINQQQ